MRFDPATGESRAWTMPAPHSGPRRLDPDAAGVLWIPEYASNRLARFDPRSERFAVYPLPTRGAMLRHIDVDERTGDVWGAYGPWPPIAPRIVRLRAP